MEVTINLPVAFSVRDTHEFQSHRDMLVRIHPELTVKEVATGIHQNGGPTVYWGLVYIKGQEIGEEELTVALRLAGYDFAHNGKNFRCDF